MKTVFTVLIRTVFILLILLAGGLSGGYFLYQHENRAPDSLPETLEVQDMRLENGTVLVRIRPGESLISLADRLLAAGLTRSSLVWRLFPYLYGGSIKVGEYAVKGPMKANELHALFTSGKVVLHRITIPEGLTSGKIARRLEDAGFCRAADFLEAVKSPRLLEYFDIPTDSLEGYLFPETWHFPEQYPAERIVEDMASLFFKTVGEIYPAYAKDRKALHEKVILASIVEREAYLKEEAGLIAGVFQNRLGISMPLQSCATVEYIITEIQGKPHPYRLFDTDVAMDHPYNTYINPGLPPGPIANPGRNALEAVFSPQSSDFLYFRLIDADRGEHAFSKSFDEHLEYGLLFNRRNGRN